MLSGSCRQISTRTRSKITEMWNIAKISEQTQDGRAHALLTCTERAICRATFRRSIFIPLSNDNITIPINLSAWHLLNNETVFFSYTQLLMPGLHSFSTMLLDVLLGTFNADADAPIVTGLRPKIANIAVPEYTVTRFLRLRCQPSPLSHHKPHRGISQTHSQLSAKRIHSNLRRRRQNIHEISNTLPS